VCDNQECYGCAKRAEWQRKVPTHVVVDTADGAVISHDFSGASFDAETAALFAEAANDANKVPTYKVFALTAPRESDRILARLADSRTRAEAA
jgi:hypothetical protein